MLNATGKKEIKKDRVEVSEKDKIKSKEQDGGVWRGRRLGFFFFYMIMHDS